MVVELRTIVEISPRRDSGTPIVHHDEIDGQDYI